MKIFSLMVLLGAAMVGGCASRAPGAAAEAPAAAASRQASVAIPAASAKKIVLVMSGPPTVTQARDWPAFREEWRATFADHAKDAGILFSMLDAAPGPGPDAGTVLHVHVNDYRLVGIGARIFLGIMTGNAYIDARVSYADLKSGKPLGMQNYNTSSSASQGVFGKMTPQQVDAIADGVFRELKAAR